MRIQLLATTETLKQETGHYPFTVDGGFKYHPDKPGRFDTKAVREHCDLLLNHFVKALENIGKRAPLTFERAWFTNHDSALILQAAERSERRLLVHVLRYTEAKYGVHLESQQLQLDHFMRKGRTTNHTRRAMGLMPLPYVDLAIMQYCHMLSSSCYQDDTHRGINRLYGENRIEDPVPLIDLPYPLERILNLYGDKKKQADGSLKPKNFDFERLNWKHTDGDYLHWPEGGPLSATTRLLDEIPERMTCARCERDSYFTKDKGETWFSFLEGEDVLCRYCGCFNNLLTLKWMYFRDDMVGLRQAISYFRKPEGTAPMHFPDMLTRHSLGTGAGRHIIDRVLRHSLPNEEWDRLITVLKEGMGYESDWAELLTQARLIDRDLPSINIHPNVLRTDTSTFWCDLIHRYKTTLNHVTTVDFHASIANLRNFADNIDRLYGSSQEGNAEPSRDVNGVAKVLDKLKLAPKLGHENRDILPEGSGLKYERFMRLKAKHPTKDLLPTIAIELMWRTHLLYPAYYHRWCLLNLHCWVDHAFDKDERGQSLDTIKKRYDEISELWWKEYDEEYVADPKKWQQFFSIKNEYANGWVPRDKRAGLTTAQDQRRRMPYWAQNVENNPPELTDDEQEELYQTLFDSRETRQLITTRLVHRTMSSKHKRKNSVPETKLSSLDMYLNKHWEDEHNELLAIVDFFPSLNRRMTKQVDTIITAINLLFKYDMDPPTSPEEIFKQKDMSLADPLPERLLMWLCLRHCQRLHYRRMIPEFMKILHLNDVMRYRVEISPADLSAARVVSFLETHYAEVIKGVVKKCEPLFENYIIDDLPPTPPHDRRREPRVMRSVLLEENARLSLASSGWRPGFSLHSTQRGSHSVRGTSVAASSILDSIATEKAAGRASRGPR
ncbi:hypothetical protein Dda_1157 [Drechslerella dactyloides]|uniref:Uncharacterized protein n=1 Tax=Drechslerella dactyloides TaxID=74499 RepID=A0AAD6J8L7_DREDA|nr:hypothetical protein Dda_1157 [Drechslerella dactyloides]